MNTPKLVVAEALAEVEEEEEVEEVEEVEVVVTLLLGPVTTVSCS